MTLRSTLFLALAISSQATAYAAEPAPATAPAFTRKVRLEIRAPQAKEVTLVGPAAGPDGVRMRRGDDWRWWTVLDLAPGRWGYAFVVDGKPMLDEEADGTEPDGKGGQRSYREVAPEDRSGEANPDVPHGTIELRKLKSAILKEEWPFNVYLPPGFDGTKKYPVLYLLHGMGMTEGQWVTGKVQNYLDNLLAQKRILPMVVIMPGVPGESGYVGDTERYVVEELVPHVAKTLPVEHGPGRTAISGMSMGGFGAFYLAYRHPEIFGYVDALSSGTREPNFLQDLDADLKAGKPFKPQLVVRCGKQDGIVVGFNQSLIEILEHRKVRFTSELKRGGHDWEYWHSVLATVLEGVSGFFRAAK